MAGCFDAQSLYRASGGVADRGTIAADECTPSHAHLARKRVNRQVISQMACDPAVQPVKDGVLGLQSQNVAKLRLTA